MSTPPAARNWVVFVVLTASVVAGSVLVSFEAGTLGATVALALCAGVALASLLPIRYRFGGSTHALTVDEPFLLAMLIALPPAWPPVLFALGALVGNLARRTPARIPSIRVAFNVGSVALSASVATVAYEWLRGDAATLDPRALVAVPLAMLVYIAVSTTLIGVLFSRLGISGFRDSVADVIAVGRVPYPFNVVAGIVLGWLATRGAVAAVLGVAIIIAFFATFRASVAVRAARDRAARLRDVAIALVAASGSLDAFDEALREVAELFGAKLAEMHIIGRAPRWVGRDGAVGGAPGPSRAAAHGLTLERASSLAAGTKLGGPDGALVSPLRDVDGIVGVLVLHSRRSLEPWEDADEDVLDSVAGEILVALRNAELVDEIAGERFRLAAQTKLLGGVLDAVSDGIAMIDARGQVLAWNPGMATLTGVGRGDAMAKEWSAIVKAFDDRDRPVDEDLARAAAGATLARTWRIVPVAGDDRWVRIVLTPVTDPDRPGVVIVARDVTASREVDRVKADFIATVSHELRTPLTPLKGFLELAERRELSPAMQAEMRTSMRRQIARLESLVDDLLAMAELDRDLVDLQETEHSLAPMLLRLPAAFDEANAEGRLQIEPSTVSASGDPDAVDRILTALVSNALKHTSGTVHVRVEAGEATVTVTVADEGPGIAIGDQEAIFERFHRLGDHLHRTQGPGLGLPIARALARRLGGDVTVDSAPDRGSTFELTLPAVTEPGAPTAAG